MSAPEVGDPLTATRAELASVRHLLRLRTDALARVTREADALRARATDDAKAVERGRDLAHVWETTEPHTLMSRRRAAAILSEVLAP
ncbi:MAG: hypothetical protein L0I24_25570 [Pseudonocardia sp.]|nr:hypothetical protein [Pseudonocardia sp.]